MINKLQTFADKHGENVFNLVMIFALLALGFFAGASLVALVTLEYVNLSPTNYDLDPGVVMAFPNGSIYFDRFRMCLPFSYCSGIGRSTPVHEFDQ